MLLDPGSLLTTTLLALVIAFAVTQVANLATTIYLHRGLSHRALTVNAPLSWTFRVIVWLTTGIRPRQWVAVHRKHHAYTDQPEDPHSPARLGWMRVQLTNVALYRAVAGDPDQVARYARDLPRTRADRMLFDHAFVGLGIGVALLVALFGWQVALIASVVHFVGYIGLSGAVNAVAHTFGRRPYDNSATNVQWLAFLTAGEGLHNNHHAAPTSARFSLARAQWDLAWPFIRACRRIGLIKVRHDAPVFVSTSAEAA